MTPLRMTGSAAAGAAAAALAAFLVAGVLDAPGLRAQGAANQKPQPTVPQWQIDAGGAAKFDVASVKQNITHDSEHNNVGLAGLDEGPPNGGLLSAVNTQLSTFIMFAYKLTPAQNGFVSKQMPKWADVERFDIEARAPGSPTRDQMRLMMQSLLADRFKLAVHTETRQMPVFALVLDKPGKFGPRLNQLAEDMPCGAKPAVGAPPPPRKYEGYFTPCGNVGLLFVSGRIHIGSQNIAMAQLANMLSVTSFGSLDPDRPILDRTGLTGKFDFTVDFTPDPGGPAKTIPNFQPDASGPTFFEALREQLGLKLIPQTGAVDVLVVDDVEEPTPN